MCSWQPREQNISRREWLKILNAVENLSKIKVFC